MQSESKEKEDEIFNFVLSDEALEQAADTIFSLGNCTDARVCPISG